MSELAKDPIISVRSTQRGKDKAGRDVLTLYIGGGDPNSQYAESNAAQVDALISALESIRGNPGGIKLKIHTTQKNEGGRTFDSSFFFVSAVGEKPGMSRGPIRAVPKTNVAAVAADLKSRTIKT